LFYRLLVTQKSDDYIYFLALLVVIEETDDWSFRVEAPGSRLAGIMEKSHELEECLSGYRFFDDFGKVLLQELSIGRIEIPKMPKNEFSRLHRSKGMF